MIFSLFAKSRARSNGILDHGQPLLQLRFISPCLPNAFQMHGPNLDDMSHFFTLQDTVSSPSSHPSNVQKLCAIDHVIICSSMSTRFESIETSVRTLTSCNTNALRLDLEAQTTFVFPKSRSHSWFHSRWSNLSSSVKSLLSPKSLP